MAGYSLARKDWCRFYIDSISEIDWNSRAFEELVLAEERKSVLEALVTSHEFPSDVRDQTKQKGKGLVILLHGTPGSGKTLSAGKQFHPIQKPKNTQADTSSIQSPQQRLPRRRCYRLRSAS